MAKNNRKPIQKDILEQKFSIKQLVYSYMIYLVFMVVVALSILVLSILGLYSYTNSIIAGVLLGIVFVAVGLKILKKIK